MGGEVRLWDLTTAASGLAFSTLLVAGSDAGIVQLASTPDGRRLAALDEKGQARLWDLTATSDLAGTAVILQGHDAPITPDCFRRR